MNNIKLLKQTVQIQKCALRNLSVTKCFLNNVVDPPDDPTITIPPYVEKDGEEIETKKARLLYQSRKRGMLENGILLSTFAAKYLKDMNENQTREYDQLINQPSNDWDIYYWATGVKETPVEFDNNIMNMFKAHVKNTNREKRYKQPDL